MENLNFLPADLRAAATKLPPDKAHTVLTLPPEGEGHNAGLVRVAAICFKMGVSFEDTLAHLNEIYAADRLDYRTAPRRAVQRVWERNGEIPEPGEEDTLPDHQEEFLLRFRRTPASTLLELSPESTKQRPTAIIRQLFKPDQIVNVQFGKFEAGTLFKVADLPDDLREYKFLNPAHFKKVEGVPNPLDGDKIATRCNANVKDRPFMVLEMDSKDDAKIERFTTFALELAKFCPLVMAVDTGNKSIHFWFDARDEDSSRVSAIFKLAVLHGADRQMGVKSQIARMPNVSASDEGRAAQRVLYFDPNGENYPSGGWDVPGFEKFIKQARQLEYYYDGSSGKYYAQSNSEAWIALNRTSLTNQLAKQGFRAVKLEGEVLSPVEAIIADVEMDKSIEAAMKGASGRHAGYYEENGFRLLVLKSPMFIKPRKGKWPVIQGFLRHLLDHTPEQYDVFMGWLSSSAKDLRNGGRRRAIFSPAQFLHIAGPADSGKSLLLKFILPAVFGGRSADCDALFEDKGASFNSDMFMSELLYLDDSDVLQTDHKFRAKFGERIKSFTVGAGGSYHQKFGDKVPVAPWWRFIRLMNEEPQTIATLPPLEDGVADKLIILRAQKMDGGPIDKSKPGWFEPVRDAIAAELPAFLHHLLEEYRIPADIQDPAKRYAVKSYLNPDILTLLAEDSPESYLHHKISTDAYHRLFIGLEEDKPEPWEGTAQELYTVLAETGTRNSQERFRKTCPSPKVLASQLRAAAKVHPDQFIYSAPKKKNGVYFWTLRPARIVTEDDIF